MTYHELIALYKQNNLDEQKKKEVESDIEKQEAISEYLFDREDTGMEDELDSYFTGATGKSDAEKEKESNVTGSAGEDGVHETIQANRSSAHGKNIRQIHRNRNLLWKFRKPFGKLF